jgi:hypothetical protein
LNPIIEWRETQQSGVNTVQCPIFTREEDFCLHENCRYYDAGLQECMYDAATAKKREQEAPPPPACTAAEKLPQKAAESRAGFEQPGNTSTTQIKKTIHPENDVEVSAEYTSCACKMNAKEVWDRLKIYNETEGIPGYEALIESLIQVVNSTPGIHYLTPKEIDFWRSRVHGIGRYLVPVETVPG